MSADEPLIGSHLLFSDELSIQLSYELFVVLFLSHKSHFYMLDTYSLPNKMFCKYPLPVQGLSFSFC